MHEIFDYILYSGIMTYTYVIIMLLYVSLRESRKRFSCIEYVVLFSILASFLFFIIMYQLYKYDCDPRCAILFFPYSEFDKCCRENS